MAIKTSPAQLLLEKLDEARRLFQGAEDSEAKHDAWLEKNREIARLMIRGTIPLESWSWLVINADSYDDDIHPDIIVQALRVIRTDAGRFMTFRNVNRVEITRTLISTMGREEEAVLRETGIALENQLVLFPLSPEDKATLFPHYRRMLVQHYNPSHNQLKCQILTPLFGHFKG